MGPALPTQPVNHELVELADKADRRIKHDSMTRVVRFRNAGHAVMFDSSPTKNQTGKRDVNVDMLSRKSRWCSTKLRMQVR